MTTVPQRYRRADGRTDGRTTYKKWNCLTRDVGSIGALMRRQGGHFTLKKATIGKYKEDTVQTYGGHL